MAWKFFTKDGAEKRVAASVFNPMARARQTVAQSIPTGGINPVTFDALDFDTDAIWAAGTPTRLTIQHAGRYLVSGQVSFVGSAAGSVREVSIRKNGTTQIAVSRQLATTSTGGATATVDVVAVVALNAGDYIELGATQDSGGALNTVVVAGYEPRLEASKIDGAVVSYVGVPGSLVGQELAYTEVASQQSTSATTETTATAIVTAPSITFDGSTVAMIEFGCSYIQTASAANANCALVLYDNGASIGLIAQLQSPGTTADIVPVHVKRRLTPSAGAHVYSIRAYETGGTAFITGGAGGLGSNQPIYLRITRAA